MAQEKPKRYLSFHITLCLILSLVQGVEETDDAFKNGRNLVLEYFLPINFPVPVGVPNERYVAKRDVEGSGEDPRAFSELKDNSAGDEDSNNSTENPFSGFVPAANNLNNLTNIEGSGEVESSSDDSFESSTEEDISSSVPIISESEETTTEEVSASSESEETISSTTSSEEDIVSTEMAFDKSEDFTNDPEESTTPGEEISEASTTQVSEVPATTESVLETTTLIRLSSRAEVISETTTEESTTIETTTPFVDVETTEAATVSTQPQILETTPRATVPTSQAPPSGVTPTSTEGFPVTAQNLTTPEPIVEEVFNVKTVHKTLEGSPGNILRKENLTLGADPLLIVTNTRIMDSEETVQLSSEEPKRLGAYIVIGLILLSFFSLVGYITFRKRMNRKRQEFESNQESIDTEKALLSLSDYKDNSELEENHLKNNEITPIVVKSNSQINKFEKNTNFSSPKNLNTIANEKNIEKDNVLKSTAENLTQVIIEDSPKDAEEDKNMPCMEKLIVKTRIDQDSIPKKPIIINRSSAGYIPIPQDGL